MRGLSKLLAVAAVAVACAAPAAAAGFNGGGGPLGFSGGPPNSGGAGPALPSPGGDGLASPRRETGPGHGPGGVAPPPNPGGPNADFAPPRRGAPPPHDAPRGFAGHGRGDDSDWRRRPRHYWLGGGPIFAADPSGDYVYGNDDYDDGSDSTDCWVYRKAYDRAGRLLGFVHVDSCKGQ